jgi:sulfopyruvate decarboxylase TPP-binding subunit
VRDKKKIVVLVRDRQDEALRVACGLTLAGDTVDIIILDSLLDVNNPAVAMPLEMITELELKIYSNHPGSSFTMITLEEMAKKLLEYDVAVPY